LRGGSVRRPGPVGINVNGNTTQPSGTGIVHLRCVTGIGIQAPAAAAAPTCATVMLNKIIKT